MAQKIGVYLCTGCGLDAAFDVDALEKLATGELKAAVCRRHAALCSPEGVALIRQDLDAGAAEAAVIAACSPRAQTEAFAFDPQKTVVARVNLREQVAWCQPPKAEET